ncbi:MAG: hypothetical protein UX65_C0011G0006 [Parcubacteria group bacterium GW2011_GWB1_46_8]|nr:MAG: hypothetical protein UV67_C0029G0009 [Parcubacteria group bacterium GW2011_GWC1_43_12]KKU09865.1 MAG: hypothetical protein UX14_C0033G0009 [Parcubacteria group bacterium GW2011_GWF1_45_5]KKU46032.1 MAG: hypothetical protein UX65_C0011G0006 [Parcubacteria group bacterium GW2011_GWB1_46_8]KKU47319.1 MAG: hypothetical protein UX66_C0017G0014 [Parcubacteria group bacterium GW2011_GWF2_46_8]
MDKAKQIIKLFIVISIIVQAVPAVIKYRVEIKGAAQELFGSVTHALGNIKE